MRRYLPIFLLAVFLLVTAVISTTLLAGLANKAGPDSYGSLVVYTTLPVEQATVLAETFEEAHRIKIKLISVTEEEVLEKLAAEPQLQRGDIILAKSTVLEAVKQAGYLAPYASIHTDIIPRRFTDANDFWTGVWYDPIIFAVNQDFLASRKQPPVKWLDLIDSGIRLAISDFLATDATANLYCTLATIHGPEWALNYFAKLHPQIVQYSKFLATPIRMVGMGEADLAIAVHSEALRYVADGFPIKIIYPVEKTSYTLVGVGLLKGSNNTGAKQFIDWLVQDNAYLALYKNKFMFIPTNPAANIFHEHPYWKKLRLADCSQKLTGVERQKLLDDWVQKVRLSGS